MARFLSPKTISAVSVGIGICLGSLAQQKWQQNRVNQNTCVSEVQRKDIDRILDKYQQWLPKVSAASVPMTTTPSSPQPSEMTRFAVPSMSGMLAYDDFVLHYDRRTRNAHWVFEHLTRERVKASEEAKREKSSFVEDVNVHKYFRSTNVDYKGSGFDRGHLAASANHRWSQKVMDQTFFLSNISPQVGEGFNRGAWNVLEKYVRALTKHYPHLYVVTGPLYLPKKEDDGKLYVKYEVIGKNHVAVPTHFFKVVVMVTSTGEIDLLSFVMPNQVLPSKIELKNYLVPLNTVERAAGLLIFDSIPAEKFRKVNGKEQKLIR